MKTAFIALCFAVGCGITPKGINQTSKVRIGTPIWEIKPGDAVSGYIAIGPEGTVYGGTRGNVYALDGRTGAKKSEFKPEGFMSAAAAIGSDGTVYSGSRNGNSKQREE